MREIQPGKLAPMNQFISADRTQNPGTLEALDNVRSQNVFGCHDSSVEVHKNSQLYLDVFQKCFDVCGKHMRRERVVISRAEDANLYLSVFEKYSQGCKSTSREQLIINFHGSSSSMDVVRANSENQRLQTTNGDDVFWAYSALCARGVGGHRSVNVERAATFPASNSLDSNAVSQPRTQSSIPNKTAQYSDTHALIISQTGQSSIPNRATHGRSTRNTTVGCSSVAVLRSSYTYTDLGDPDQCCRYCGASFWYGEWLKGHSHNQRPEYHLCCGGGDIHMQRPCEPPEYIKSLFGNKHFMETIRAYNQMFLMTSFGAKIDESTNNGRGPYVFKVSGQVYHWIGSLCPPLGEAPRFLQIYIYDTDNEIENRMRHFGGIDNSDLDSHIVEGLIHFLDAHNELVQLFRTTRDKCRELDIPEFKIRLYNGQGARGYEFPTSNTLGAMVFESGIRSNKEFEVIIEHKHGPPQRVSKLHPSYMSLQFPLLFIYGESGYHTELKLRSTNGRDKAKRVTMLAYYRHQLHFRLQKYDHIFRGGRLFQQYVVDSASTIRTPEDVDQYISVELPDPRIDLDGYNIVSETMMHGPCGAANLKASCMKVDKCGKNFSKKFNSKTFVDDNGHTHYQRRDTNITATRNQFKLDNSYVVPYNRDLLLAFQAHINVEYYGWSMLIKYLFKYISKGTDRMFARVSRPMGESSVEATSSREVIDEIQNYLEGHFVCAHEEYWRIFKFDLHHREPAVQILAVHLQDMQRVTFRDRDRLRSVVDLPAKKNTTLTEWFDYNAKKSTGRHMSYLEFPSEFVWYSDRKRKAGHHGKTASLPLDKTIISSLRSQGKIVLAVTSSSIASLLLPSGRTTHSRFKLPLKLTKESLCKITKNIQLGKLLADTDLIVWDKAPMIDRRCFEALDRTLRDIVSKSFSLFGGKLVLLGGDFRQTLPIKKGAPKMEIIASCISESALWPSFNVFTLKQNMRLARPYISVEERNFVNSFASWLLDIGEWKTGQPAEDNPENTSWVDIPAAYCVPPDEGGLSNLIDFNYDQSTLHTPSAITFQQQKP
ncbi:DNA helicase [Tanacetum coccineum]